MAMLSTQKKPNAEKEFCQKNRTIWSETEDPYRNSTKYYKSLSKCHFGLLFRERAGLSTSFFHHVRIEERLARIETSTSSWLEVSFGKD